MTLYTFVKIKGMDQLFIDALQYNNLPQLKRFAAIIALSLKHKETIQQQEKLSENDLKDLIPTIEDVFVTLVSIVNYNVKGPFKSFVDELDSKIPTQIEIQQLPFELYKALLDHFENPKISFKSDFLNEQLEKGNIKFNPLVRAIRLEVKSNFKDIEIDENKHKGKILTALKKEGFIYNYGRDGYIHPSP